MHFLAIKLKEALVKECWQRSVLAHGYLLVHSHLSYRCMHHNAEAHFLQCRALREGKYEQTPPPPSPPQMLHKGKLQKIPKLK